MRSYNWYDSPSLLVMYRANPFTCRPGDTLTGSWKVRFETNTTLPFLGTGVGASPPRARPEPGSGQASEPAAARQPQQGLPRPGQARKDSAACFLAESWSISS